MSETVLNRLLLTAFGAIAGLALWLLGESAEATWLSERAILFIGVLIAVFTGATLAMAGALRFGHALMRALPLAVLVAGLALLVSFRWFGIDGMLEGAGPLLALLAVSLLPVPFLIAEAGRGSWRDYPALFDIAWSIAVRGAVALAFTGLVWLVIWLSGAVLGMVGITLIEDYLMWRGMPVVVSGAAFGLAVAVVNELSSHLSPRLVHWLLRLLLPVVALVALVFTLAALLRGFDAGFPGLSPAAMLLAMAAAGTALVTAALDGDEAAATQSPIILGAARLMSLLLPVLAGLAFWASWIRISAYGFTPNRLLLLLLALIALAYGIAYAAAVLRGRAWARHIRAANPWLALSLILCATLWLTPLLNAEAISARDQAERLIDGRRSADRIGYYEFSALGIAGDRALREVIAHAETSGDRALLTALDGIRDPFRGGSLQAGAPEPDIATRRAELKELLPISPGGATGTRDMVLEAMGEWDLDNALRACRASLSGQLPGCVMVVADLLPALPGEEAVLLLNQQGWIDAYALGFMPSGDLVRLSLIDADGWNTVTNDRLERLLVEWQTTPPALQPSGVNQLGSGEDGLLFLYR